MAKITEIKDENTGRYIWIDPWFVEVLCKYLHETMESNGISTYNAVLQNQYNSFERCAHSKSGLGIDGAGIYFEPELTGSVENTATLINVLNQTKINIAALGDYITVEMLNQHESEKFYDDDIISWKKPIRTSSLVNLLDIIINMLDLDKRFDLQNYEISFIEWEDIGGVGPRYV